MVLHRATPYPRSRWLSIGPHPTTTMTTATRTLTLLILLPATLKAQDAVIEQRLTEFEVTGPRTAQCHELRVIRINNERAAGMASLSVSCNKDIELSKFTATVTDPSGKVLKKLKKGDLTRSEYSSHLVSDDYFYYLDYQPTTYPVTVTFDWEERFSGGIKSYPVFAPVTRYDIEVQQATYRLITPTAEPLRYRSLHCQPEVVTREEKGRYIHEIQMGPLPALKRQPWGQSLDERTPLVYFAPASFDYQGTHCDLTSWQTFGQWTWQLLQGRDPLPQPLIDKLHQLTDTCQTARSKVDVVRQFMAQSTRYVSIQLGIGGWQPMTATDVYQKGMGDCKALSNYFCAMLHALGLPADYVLISTEDRQILPDLPTLQQFDHVVARVPLPNDTLWVECTNPTLPAGYVPEGWSGHEALLITPEGGVMTTTPILPDAECREVNLYQVQIDAQGNATITTHSVETGRSWEADRRLEQLPLTDQKKSLQSSFLLPTSTITDVRVESQGTQLTLDWTAESQGYAKHNGQRLFIPISPTRYMTPRQNNDAPYPLDMRESGYLRIDSITLTLPEGFVVETLPKPRSIDTPMAHYSLEVIAPGEAATNAAASTTTLLIVARMELHSGLYTSPDALPTWLQFIKDRSQAHESKVVVKKQQ